MLKKINYLQLLHYIVLGLGVGYLISIISPTGTSQNAPFFCAMGMISYYFIIILRKKKVKE